MQVGYVAPHIPDQKSDQADIGPKMCVTWAKISK
jgi:hypothetical protein